MLFSEQSIEQFLSDLAARQPAPGGGAAVGVVGAIAASLAEMVIAYSRGKKSFLKYDDELKQAATQFNRYRSLLLELSEQDAAAYENLSSLMKLSKDDARRRENWDASVVACIRAPQAAMAACADMLRLLDSLTGKTTRFLKSDMVVSAKLAAAAAESAKWNVHINLSFLTEEKDRILIEQETSQVCAAALDIARRIEQYCLQ